MEEGKKEFIVCHFDVNVDIRRRGGWQREEWRRRSLIVICEHMLDKFKIFRNSYVCTVFYSMCASLIPLLCCRSLTQCLSPSHAFQHSWYRRESPYFEPFLLLYSQSVISPTSLLIYSDTTQIVISPFLWVCRICVMVPGNATARQTTLTCCASLVSVLAQAL